MLPFEKKKRCLLVSFKKEVPRRYAEESGRTSVKDGGAGAGRGSGGGGGVHGQVDWGCQGGVKGSGLAKSSAAQLSPSWSLLVTGTTCSHKPSGWTGAFQGTMGSENAPGGLSVSPVPPVRPPWLPALPCPGPGSSSSVLPTGLASRGHLEEWVSGVKHSPTTASGLRATTDPRLLPPPPPF